MKKRLLFIIWMLALLSSAHVTISSLSVANGTNVVKLGDLNADGFVNVADITQLVNFLNSNLTNQINLTAADANHDGVINSDDESAIASIILSGTPDNSSKSILFFTQPTVEKTFGVAFTNPVVCAGSTGAITYSASPDGVVTVNPATGDVSYIGIGQTTITATLAADDKYSGAKAQYTLTVVEKSTDPDDYMSIKPKASTDGNGGSLSYTGNPIPIITAGESSAGTIYYKVTSINVQPTKNDEGWTTAVPTTIAAGTYYVWYYIKGNDNTETAICGTPIRVTICNATLSGITVTAYNAVYDGNAHGITVSLNGVAEGATIKYGTTEGTYNLTTSPTYTDVTAGATVYYQVTKSNYETVTGSSTVTITHKALSIKAKDQAITFGNTIATSTDQVIVDGLVKGDALTAVTLTPSGTDVTTTGTITPSAAATANGIDNYTVTYTFGTLTITGAPMVSGVSATGYNATYDGAAHGITVALNGVAEGATIKYGTTEGTYNLTTSPTYTDVTAGATVYYQVTKSNYETVTGSSTVTITHKALSIKAKDQAITFGNTIATGTDQVIVDGLVKGDALTAVTLTPSGTDVTTTGTITPSAAATVNGIDNYTVTYTTGKLLISASLSSGVSVSACSATYDGLGHSIIVSLSGVAEGATVMYGTIEGIYDQTTSPTFTNVTDGTSVYYQVMKANYETVTGSSTVTIAKRSISISGITANNKIYDGTTAATLNYPTITTAMGLVKGDNLSVTATGTFSDANAGDSKTVTISNLALSGSSVGNYKLADSDQQKYTTANISKKPATITLSSADVSLFDNCMASFTATLSEYEASSTVIATTGNASYYTVSASALSNGVSTITVTGVEAGSADCTISASSNNYIYTKVSKPITVKANPLKTVTEEHLGYYVCTDGYYYSPDFEVPLGKTVAGFIAYVSGKGHGLILAMSDANSGSSADWSTINSACSSYTPTITSGCVTLTWRLPSMTDWENMGATSGSWKTLSSRLSALSSKVQSIQSNSSLNSSYWSCTTTSNGFPYVYNFYGKTWNAIGSYQNKYGRACAEF